MYMVSSYIIWHQIRGKSTAKAIHIRPSSKAVPKNQYKTSKTHKSKPHKYLESSITKIHIPILINQKGKIKKNKVWVLKIYCHRVHGNRHRTLACHHSPSPPYNHSSSWNKTQWQKTQIKSLKKTHKKIPTKKLTVSSNPSLCVCLGMTWFYFFPSSFWDFQCEAERDDANAVQTTLSELRRWFYT